MEDELIQVAEVDKSPDENNLELSHMRSLYEDLTQLFEEDSMTEPESVGARKRGLEVDNMESWQQVMSRKQRMKEIRGKVEICITSKDAFPKQFALAKLFKSLDISNITKVKYINPYKISVDLNDTNAERLMKCEQLSEMGWRFQRPFEVGLSYGVIKDIELDLSEEELLKSISCSTEVCNIRRLKRKNTNDSTWTECESVRVGFKGPSLPTHLFIHDMRVKVEPYVFPVTQCTKCWRFGHTHRMCPSKKSYCPRCAGKHESCEATSYRCINCTDNHMALNKSCPMYIKEKKIRDIMAELNCSYRKAMEMYVPPAIPPCVEAEPAAQTLTAQTPSVAAPQQGTNPTPTYAQKTAVTTAIPEKGSSTPNEASILSQKQATTKKRNRKKRKSFLEEIIQMETQSDIECCDDSVDKNEQSDSEPTKDKRQKSDFSFKNLLLKLKDTVFVKHESIMNKIQKSVQICVEYIITWLFHNIPDWSFVLKIMNDYG